MKHAAANAERKKFQDVVELFKKYGAKYELDYLLMAAQGYQESTLDHSARSPWVRLVSCRLCPRRGRT